MLPAMTRQNPAYRILSSIVVLSITLASRAQSVNKTIDDAYIHNPNSPQSYLDGIQYSPAWTHDGGNSQQFNGTYSYTTQRLANLIYFFQGNAIYYYSETGGNDHAPVILYLDGGSGETIQTNTSTSTQYQQLIWSKTGLGAGDHQIMVTHRGQPDQSGGLDYFVIESDHGFTPSDAGPAASKIPREAIIVDDINSDFFTYSGWETQVLQSENNNKLHYNNTMHITTVPGSSATFRFTGTAVWYITNLHPDNGLVDITLDGAPNRVVNTGSDRRLAQRIVWSEQNLAYGEHTVVMTHQDTDTKSVTVDYFMYLPGTKPPQVSGSPTGAIAGGVIGGIVLIALCVGGFIIVRRRRAAKRGFNVDLDEVSGPPLLNHIDGTPQPVTAIPAWGYVITPYAPEPNRNPNAMPHHNRDQRPRKGQLIGSISPAPNAIVPSGTTTTSSEDTESYRDALDSRDREAAVDPPPYVRR